MRFRGEPLDRTSLVRALQGYYESAGISALGFRCAHEAGCRAESRQFVAAQETYVGPDYGSSALPRLAIVSLDSGSLNPDAHQRTMDAVRRRVLADNVDDLVKTRHWYQTHALAFVLLSPFDSSLRIADTRRYFAHVNSAKCCQNNPGHAQASAVLFDNCRRFIGPELDLLQPHIIVTQGEYAARAVESGLRRVADLGDGSCRICEVRCGGQRALWIPTYHPTARGGLYQAQRDQCWARYTSAVSAFFETSGA